MNSSPDGPSIIWGVVMVVIALSALMARRIPWRQAFPMVGAWMVIIALLFVGFSYREQVKAVWVQVTQDFRDEPRTEEGGLVRLPRDESGHFIAKAQVNGQDVAFLIDTGATYTSFPEAMALDLGIIVDKSGFPTMSSTANGDVRDWRARVSSLRVGSIVRNDFPVRVTEGQLSEALLGMNWLSTLKSWRVEGSEMVLEP